MLGQDSHPDVRALVSLALFKKGKNLREKGDFEAALAIYDEYVLRFGDNISIFSEKGRILELQGKLDAALAVYDDMVRRLGSDYAVAMSLVRKGQILEQQGKIGAAIALYDEVERRFEKGDRFVRVFVHEAHDARIKAEARLSNPAPHSP
jgi:tetratricopeptide (TPR) repeat protein